MIWTAQIHRKWRVGRQIYIYCKGEMKITPRITIGENAEIELILEKNFTDE